MLAIDGGFTMRNRVINGCCRVAQRGSVSLSTTPQFGVVDRMLGSYVNGSAGTLTQLSNAGGMTYKRAVIFSGVTLTSGYIIFSHRIEALNTLDLSGQTVTVSAKIYHDYGTDENFFIGLRKPSTTIDTFSATSTITAVDIATTCPSGAVTTISATLPLGATEADLGLEVVIYHNARTTTTKNVAIGDIQLTLGSEVEQMERRSIGVEDALCKRYCIDFADTYAGCNGSGTFTSFRYALTLPVSMRVNPTVTFSNVTAGFTATNLGGSGQDKRINIEIGASARSDFRPRVDVKAEAEL